MTVVMRTITLIICVTLASLPILVTDVAAERRREVRIGVPGLSFPLDPATSLGGATALIAPLVFETLASYRPGTTDIHPSLATRWSVSRDGLTWSFTIRENARFHDGTPLTAREVRTSFERLMVPTDPRHPSPNVVWPTLLRGLPGVVKALRSPDASTFQIVLVQPYAPLLTVLAHPGFGVSRVPGGDGQLVGSGPYRVVDAGPGRIALESAGAGVRTERLVFVDVAAETQAEQDLDTGVIDIWLPAHAPGRTQGALTVPGTRAGILVMQTAREPFSKRRVRQAIAAALDPGQISNVLERSAVPLQSFLPPAVWGRREGSPLMAANRDPGRRVVADGQWPKGFTATLLVADAAATGSPVNQQGVANSIAAALTAADLPVQVRVEAPERLRVLTQAGTYDMALIEVTAEGGDPHHFLYPLSTTEGATKGAQATNLSFYRNRAVDDLLIRASQLSFRPERERLYTRAQALLAEELPWIPIYVGLRWAVTRPEVRGLRLHPTGVHRLDAVAVEAAAAR